MHTRRLLHLTASLLTLLAALVLLRVQLQGVTLISFLRGLTELRNRDLLLIVMVDAAFLLLYQGRGLLNLLRLEEQSIASLEKRHPYLPTPSQTFVSLALMLVSVVYTTPVAAKTYRVATSMMGGRSVEQSLLDPNLVVFHTGDAGTIDGSTVNRHVCAGDAATCDRFLTILDRLPAACHRYIRRLRIAPVGRGDLHGFSDTYGNVTLAPTDDDVRAGAMFAHECGHVIDFFALRGSPKAPPTAFTFRTMPTNADDPSLDFYRISWKDAVSKKDAVDQAGFVSEYATLLPIEDFAETYVYYLFHRDAFRQRAAGNVALQQKLGFMERLVGTGSLLSASGSVWTGALPSSVTGLPFTWK